MRNRTSLLIVFTLSTLILTSHGCTMIFQKGRRVDVDKISKLKNELVELEREKTDLEREKTDLERAKEELDNRLRNEIRDEEVQVEMGDRGLVITFVAEVLFDSGKAELRQGSRAKLDKVARVLKTTVQHLDVGVEGHTDNVPIKHSGWKSNWELSTARALGVLHHLVDNQGIAPERLAAIGYGEFRPIASNATPEGRQKNRRVEIVIIPAVEKEGR